MLFFIYTQNNMATITARIDDTKKSRLIGLCDEMGISMGTLFNIWINDFLRTPKINIELDDTHRAWYEDKDIIEVNEPIETVIDYLQSHIEETPHG